MGRFHERMGRKSGHNGEGYPFAGSDAPFSSGADPAWPAEAGTPVTPAAAVTADAGADTLTVADAPISADGTPTLTYAIDGGASVPVNVALTAGMSPLEVIAAIEAALTTDGGLTFSTVGNVITVAPGTGTDVTTLTWA